MKKNYNLPIISILIGLIYSLSSCQSGESTRAESGSEHAHEHKEGEEHAEELALTAAQIQQVNLSYAQLKERNLSDAVTINGALAVPNDHKAFVTALFGGVLKSLSVQPGDIVRKGQLIGTMSNPSLYPMQQQLQTVQNQIALTQLELARQQELVAGNAAPLKRLQQVQTELANLQTQRQSLRAQLSEFGASQQYSSTVSLKAPIAGVVSKIFSQIGSNVDLSSPILELVDNSELHLDLYVYEQDLSKIRKGQQISFTTVNNPSQQHTAEIILIGGAFEQNSSAIAVHAKVLGEKTNLIEGMQVTASLSLTNKLVQSLPDEAIVTYQGVDYIFVVHKQGPAQTEFERIAVAKGVSKDGFTAVTPLQTIDDQAQVVAKGAFFLLAKMTNAGEHSH